MALRGKVAMCLGATSGIGKAVAYNLAILGADIALLSRNESVGSTMVQDWRTINPAGHFEFINCDASLMKSIQNSCKIFNSKFDKLNFCIQSQGIASVGGRKETNEGIDEKMSLHYYGRICFIQQLESVLQGTATKEDVRVLSIFSGGVHSSFDALNKAKDDFDLKHNYTLSNVANATGFYTDLAFEQLARQHNQQQSKISFIHAAPGFVATAWGAGFPLPLRAAVRAVQAAFAKTPAQCADVMVASGLLGPHMGGAVRAHRGIDGFHIMNADGSEGKLTRLHSVEIREEVWMHTSSLLQRGVANS